MAKVPHPGKGLPKSQWPKKGSPEWAVYYASQEQEKAKMLSPTKRTEEVAETAAASFDPNIVRDTLQPPEKKADAAFPQQRVEPEPYQFSEENIPPNLFSGDQKHLEVMGINGSMTDPIPGYKLYWFDAKNGVRIAMAQRSGYTFVEKHEVLLNDGLEGSDDLGTHVRKIGNIFGGETEDGKPQYMYLMKKPLWLVDKHNVQMEAINQKYEQMLKSGQISRNQQDRQFAGGSDVARSEHSKLPSIDIQSKLYR